MIKVNHFIARIPDVDVNIPTCNFFEHHLLVYENTSVLSGEISQNIRDLVGRFPFVNEITICCPSISDEELFRNVQDGTGLLRTTLQGTSKATTLSTLEYCQKKNAILLRDVSQEYSDFESRRFLPDSLVEAWLFDLFHRHHCLVSAPEGIHFGKTSGKHSTQFIRAANALVGSLQCSLIAFFLIPKFSKFNTKKIYVDTGPLVAVAMSLSDQLRTRKHWVNLPTIESFSSYEGLDKLENAQKDQHIILISASTSGGLEADIVKRTKQIERIATLFFIQAKDCEKPKGYCLSNLTESSEKLCGYPEIETYSKLNSCKWCGNGVPLAQFEGDQFLLQTRKTQLINISYHPTDESKRSLKEDALIFFQKIKSLKISKIRVTSGDSDGYRDVRIDENEFKKLVLLQDTNFCESLFAGTINPKFFISKSILPEDLAAMDSPHGHGAELSSKYLKPDDLLQVDIHRNGAALVVFGLVASLLEPRKISELLRSRIPDGEIRYIFGATLIETPEQYRQLSVALKTGARGPSTFDVNTGLVIYLRKRFESATTWEKEIALLDRLVAHDQLHGENSESEITNRLAYLKNSGEIIDGLFWPDQNGSALKLQSDFVWMAVDGAESQADIYAIISCLISTAIQLNRDPKSSNDPTDIRKYILDSVYSEALIDPNNFLKFNDAILRAAILRVALSSELNYSNNLEQSSLLTQLIEHEIEEWKLMRGQVLPEFLIALSIGHLKLCAQHATQISSKIRNSIHLPRYIKRLSEKFSE